jgi:hypothetical protein
MVVDLHHSEIGEAVVRGMQETQTAAEQESRRGDDEGQNSAVNPERSVHAIGPQDNLTTQYRLVCFFQSKEIP